MEHNNQPAPTSTESAAGNDGDSGSKVDETNVIVNYLPATVNERQLRDLFGVHGAIKSVKIVRDPVTNVRKGYGFVKYSRAEDASAAISALNGHPVAGKKLKVGIARERFDASKSCKLMITNLSIQCTTEEVHELFCKHGEIVQCRMVPHKQNLHRGNDQMCFVLYTTHEAARKALCEPEYVLHGRRLSVSDAIGNHDQQQQPQQLNRSIYSQSSFDGSDDGSQRSAYHTGVVPIPNSGTILQHQQFQRASHAPFEPMVPPMHQGSLDSRGFAKSISPRGSPYESGGTLSSVTYYASSNTLQGPGQVQGSGPGPMAMPGSGAMGSAAGTVGPPPYYSTMPPQGGGGSGSGSGRMGAGSGANPYGAPSASAAAGSASVNPYTLDSSEGMMQRQYPHGAAYQEHPASSPSPVSSNQGSFRYHGDIMPSTSHDSSDDGRFQRGHPQRQYQYQDPQQPPNLPGQSPYAPYIHSQSPVHGQGQGQGQGHLRMQQPPAFGSSPHTTNSASVTSSDSMNAEQSPYSSARGGGNSKGRGTRAPQQQLVASPPTQMHPYATTAAGPGLGPGPDAGSGGVFDGSSASAAGTYYYSSPHGGPPPPPPPYYTAGPGPNMYGGQAVPTEVYISAPAGSYNSSVSGGTGSAHSGSWSNNPLDSGGSGRSSSYGGSGRGRSFKKKNRGGGGGGSDSNQSPGGFGGGGGAAAQAYQSALSGVTAPTRGATQPHYLSMNAHQHEVAGYSAAPGTVSYSVPSQPHGGQYSQTQQQLPHHAAAGQHSPPNSNWQANPHSATDVPPPEAQAPRATYSPASPPSAEMAAASISDRSKGGQSASFCPGNDHNYATQSEKQYPQQTQWQRQQQQAKYPASGYLKRQQARDVGRALSKASSETYVSERSSANRVMVNDESRSKSSDASSHSTAESGSSGVAEPSSQSPSDATSESHKRDAAEFVETAAHDMAASATSSPPHASSTAGPGTEVDQSCGESGGDSSAAPAVD